MICNICEKESVCKLIDGSNVVKCAEFLGIKETDYKMTSDDCISRKSAIDALGYNISITSDEGLDEYRTVLKEMLCKIYDTQVAQIEALPSIQPKPKTDVLDKIRAEIKEESRFCPLTEGLERALEIINKYTTEKEK